MAAGTYNGLPRRVRQANLSPHLRNGDSPGPSAMVNAATGREPPQRSPEQARDLFASLQTAWERGREGEQAPGPPVTEGPARTDTGEHHPPHEEG
jgi:hypothetical protein